MSRKERWVSVALNMLLEWGSVEVPWHLTTPVQWAAMDELGIQTRVQPARFKRRRRIVRTDAATRA